MYRDLIINLSLVISFLSISGQIFRNKPLYHSNFNKIIGGIIAGILGITLMIFSIQINDTTIMDLRNFSIMVVIIYGGIVSGVIAGGIISFGRVALFGLNTSSVTAVITIISLVIISKLILNRANLSTFKKFLFINIGNIIIVSLAFIYLITDKQELFNILVYYGTISLFGGFLIYYLCEYIARSNENFRELKTSTQIDFLTGLNNVRHFDEVWNHHVQNAKDKNERLSIFLIDIDHFKNINDTYGHPIGDLVLKELGKVLKQTTRSFDTVSRNGGEEFSVILPDCPSHQAIEIAERIRSTVENYQFSISEKDIINITISIGVVTFPETIEDTSKMIEKADECLYRAKHSGRNKVLSCIS